MADSAGASVAAMAQGWRDASGITVHAKNAVAAMVRTRLRPERGTLGSRIAIRRPSSCERCAIARLAPAISAGKRPERMTRATSIS